MILGQISYLDCLVFLVFLTPQLLIHVGLLRTIGFVLQALPHLALRMPIDFVRERYFIPHAQRTPFVQNATVFQDIVIRCVRYAFANMPAYIGRVFFSREVSLPFMWFRMLRHGYLRTPVPWREVNESSFKGLWIVWDESEEPDVVVFYCHGGGFSMGSSYFYMEFLIAWISLLRDAGFRNPALFALEYSLVPDAVYPTQVHQALAGYKHVLSKVNDAERICVGGDSAGSTLILSLLLLISDHPAYQQHIPGYATLISPWVTIISENNQNTPSDYLNADSLHLYGSQYLGDKVSQDDPMASPGKCVDGSRWKAASPSKGWFFAYGSDEVLAPETDRLVSLLREIGCRVETETTGVIHAWPVASLYLGESKTERLLGLEHVVKAIRGNLGGRPKT